MFCPICKDEFRPGFTRCAGCDVDLVESPGGSSTPSEGAAGAATAAVTAAAATCGTGTMIEYCGFVALDEARRARDLLRGEAIRSEIAIREGPGSVPGGELVEEYWLRVQGDRYRDVVRVLGFHEAQAPDVALDVAPDADDTFACGDCGADVSVNESFCPGCGARFEES